LELNLDSIDMNDSYGFIERFMAKNSDNPEEILQIFHKKAYSYVHSKYKKEFNASDQSDIRLLKEFYAATVFQVDGMVEQLVEGLKRAGVYDNTIIVISSDHGDEIYEHGALGHFNFNEETLHVPLLMRFPGIEHFKIESIVENIDIMPTLLASVGIGIPSTVQGKNLLPYILNRRQPPESAAFAESWNRHTIRTDKWRYVYNGQGFNTHFGPLPNEQLLKVENGEDSQENFIDEYPQVATSLKEKIVKWQKENLKCDFNPVSTWKPYVTPEAKENIKKTGYW